jgi:hypothetical protein
VDEMGKISTDEADVDWEKLSDEMEEYAKSLEGDDEELKVEDSADAEGEGEIQDADKPQDKPGGSNVGKYKTKGPFCGPSGGAPKGSYPVNTKKRAQAALAYARHAPNPAGIKKCVCRHWPDLPSCGKANDSVDTELLATSLKDSVLSSEKLAKLPASKFCGPGKTFPVIDDLHYTAITKLLDGYEGEADLSKIKKNVARKAKAFGYKIVEKQAEPAPADVQDQVKPEEGKVEDSMDHIRVMRSLLEVLTEESYASEPVLADEDKKMLQTILKRLASLVNQDAMVEALVTESIAVAPSCYQDVLDEVFKHEETIGDLREQLDNVRKEYTSLYSDIESLQDRLVNEKENLRKSKELHLTTLMSLSDHKENEKDLTKLEDTALDTEINRILQEVDMTQIADKLGDGMSRVPTEIVDNPTDIQDGGQKNQKRTPPVQELAEFEQKYWSLKFKNSLAAERLKADQIKRWQAEGYKLPIKEEE